MKLFKALSPFILASFFLLASCQTYHMTTQSLVEQMVDTKKEKKTTVVVAFPFFIPFTVNGNSLKEIKVLDKNDKETTLPVTQRTGIRITKKDGQRKTFYFNTLIVKDSTITGKKDHFMGIDIKPISLNNIEKIELQK